jgi:DNA-binding FadR family transcriptional regulator
MGNALAPRPNLSARVAGALLERIRTHDLPPGTRLPSEQMMAERFGVSRTVIREAIATLKAEGLVETRQGSGAFVRQPSRNEGLRADALEAKSIDFLLHFLEVRRGIEGETAALAALRRSPQQLAKIHSTLSRIDEAVAAGRDGVEEDLSFHLSIAEATSNPYWVRIVGLCTDPLRAGIRVTRANEARRNDFTQEVRAEHSKVCEAIAAGNPIAAHAAARAHMENAARRVKAADREFWHGEGGIFVRKLAKTDLRKGSARKVRRSKAAKSRA